MTRQERIAEIEKINQYYQENHFETLAAEGLRGSLLLIKELEEELNMMDATKEELTIAYMCGVEDQKKKDRKKTSLPMFTEGDKVNLNKKNND
jgi:hypothetical protein